MIAENVRDAARVMRHELRENRLVVVLVPSQDPDMAMRGGKIRVAVSHNPQWYQAFCNDYPTSRSRPRFSWKKHDTMIKRAHTLRALKEIEGGGADTEYPQRLLPVCQKRLKAYLNGEW